MGQVTRESPNVHHNRPAPDIGSLNSLPETLGIDSPDFTAVLEDFAGLLDADGVLNEVTDPSDQRAYVALLGTALIAFDDPAAMLRERAEMVLADRGRGPVLDQSAFSKALGQTADLLEMGM